MHSSFNGITVIVDKNNNRISLLSKHHRNFLEQEAVLIQLLPAALLAAEG